VTDGLVPVGEGHTAVHEEERADLIPTYIATRGELFAAEEANIAAGTYGLAPTPEILLDDLYLRELHRRMFAAVWKWAGSYRLLETNIGVDPIDIATGVRSLVADTLTWLEYATFDHDELAVRFHHRLVFIHPFVNGNGRHGRIATDLLTVAIGRPQFTWGRNLRVTTEELRARYQQALQKLDADQDDVADLVAFART